MLPRPRPRRNPLPKLGRPKLKRPYLPQRLSPEPQPAETTLTESAAIELPPAEESAVVEPTVDALYEQVRARMPAQAEAVPTELTPVAPGIRVLALRTPTLPPAAHTNVYLVGPEIGPVAVIDPGSPYPDQQAILDAFLATVPIDVVLLTHHHGDHIGGATALAARWGAPIHRPWWTGGT